LNVTAAAVFKISPSFTDFWFPIYKQKLGFLLPIEQICKLDFVVTQWFLQRLKGKKVVKLFDGVFNWWKVAKFKKLKTGRRAVFLLLHCSSFF
jgi:hypothetical protein